MKPFTITGLFFCLLTTVLGVTLSPTAAAAPNTCEKAIQGKIAWNYKGTKIWGKPNINNLCKGQENSSQPALCFQKVMHSGVNYGSGTKWQWQNALNLCKGTPNAQRTVQCFIDKQKVKKNWRESIAKCSSSASPKFELKPFVSDIRPYIDITKILTPVTTGNNKTCFNAVQGKIAWNYAKTKSWAPANINNLCKGAENSIQPANCFNGAMHGSLTVGTRCQMDVVQRIKPVPGNQKRNRDAAMLLTRKNKGQTRSRGCDLVQGANIT